MTKAAELAKIVDASGNVVTSGTVEPAGDTAAGDNAAIGFTSAEGIVITGQGSTNDVTIKNDADADVIEIPTGTTNVTVAGTLTATGFIIGSADINENDLESIDGITAGTIAASKAAIVDTNKDITGFRNITLTGELDAATLDISGNADIDGTLEADAITIGGTAIASVLSPVAGSSSIVTTGALNSGSITSGFGAIDTGSSNITSTGVGTFGSLDISGDIDVDGTTNLDVVDIDGAVDMASTLTVTGAAILNGGIDVAGDFNFDVGGGDITLKDDGTSVANIGMESGSFILNAPTSDTDIIFKGNDGGSAITALTLDMSAGGMAIFSGGVNLSSSAISFSGSISTPQTAAAIFRPADNVLAFSTANNERMRIDSSGNLLVGKTTTAFGTAGVRILPTGNIYPVANGSVPLEINRLTSDGDIVKFYKDSSAVGSIGNAGARLFINSGTVGLNFAGDGSDQILPSNAGANRDAAIDLGTTNVRFKDLYLSSGVFLGGTGSANELDDYEEGAWTPTYTGSGGNPTVTYDALQFGFYTRIGRKVFIIGRLRTDAVSGGAGTLQVSGLPYTVNSSLNSNNYTSGGGIISDAFGSNNPHSTMMIANSTSFYCIYGNYNANQVADLQNGSNKNQIQFSFFYIAA
jgi:hypothetical protein